LRQLSSNTGVLRAAIELAPAGVLIDLYSELDTLPIFNPDLEGREPAAVLSFRKRLAAAQGYIIASTEYAHGVSGPLKNALDWVVGSAEFTDKPTALLNTTARTALAYAALGETLTVMGARLVPAACLTVPLAHNKLTTAQILDIVEYVAVLQHSLSALLAEVAQASI
jgi:NAD(P)H-dependent FMN reductase